MIINDTLVGLYGDIYDCEEYEPFDDLADELEYIDNEDIIVFKATSLGRYLVKLSDKGIEFTFNMVDNVKGIKNYNRIKRTFVEKILNVIYNSDNILELIDNFNDEIEVFEMLLEEQEQKDEIELLNKRFNEIKKRS